MNSEERDTARREDRSRSPGAAEITPTSPVPSEWHREPLEEGKKEEEALAVAAAPSQLDDDELATALAAEMDAGGIQEASLEETQEYDEVEIVMPAGVPRFHYGTPPRRAAPSRMEEERAAGEEAKKGAEQQLVPLAGNPEERTKGEPRPRVFRPFRSSSSGARRQGKEGEGAPY